MTERTWQPIDTAPRTHSVIVWEEGVMGEAYYHEEEKSWWWANTGPGDFALLSRAIYPTLWHPMPAPPRKR